MLERIAAEKMHEKTAEPRGISGSGSWTRTNDIRINRRSQNFIKNFYQHRVLCRNQAFANCVAVCPSCSQFLLCSYCVEKKLCCCVSRYIQGIQKKEPKISTYGKSIEKNGNIRYIFPDKNRKTIIQDYNIWKIY